MAASDPRLPTIPGDISTRINDLVGRLDKLREGSRNLDKVTAALAVSEKKLTDESKKAQKGVIDLEKAVKVLGKDSATAKEGMKRLASEFAKGMETMSQAQKDAFDKTMADIKSVQGGGSAKDLTRDQLILGEQKRKMEVANYRDLLQQEVLRGKAIQTSGQGLSKATNLVGGSIQGMWNKAKILKSDAVAGVGQALGLSGEAMAALTGPVVLLTGVFLALSAVMKGEVEHANDAAKAGFAVGDSMQQASMVGNQYALAINHATDITGMARKEILELAGVFNQEMGQSIDHTMAGSIELAKGLGSVGLTFGIAATEAVKLGVKMGVFSRGSARDTRVMFESLGETAASLNVNMEALADPMLELARASGEAGAGTMDAVTAMQSITRAAMGLSDVGGPFNRMFSTMKDADKVGAIKNFVTNFTKIGDLQWSAFSMKRGEGVWNTIGRVANAGVNDKLGYIGDLSRKLGTDKMKDPTQRAFTMGYVASQGKLGDDFKSNLQFGQMLLDAKQNNKSANAQDLLASQLDQRFQNKQSLGQYLAGGGDVMNYIANTLVLMLDEVKTIASTITRVASGNIFGGDQQPAGTGSGLGYGRKAATSGRSTGPVRGAAAVSR